MEIKAMPQSVSRYQRLLVEWNKDFPDQVIALLGSVLSEDPHDLSNDVKLESLRPEANCTLRLDEIRIVNQKIAGFSQYVPLPELPRFPANYEPPKRPPKSVRQAELLTAYLALHAVSSLEGDIAFFQDLQALAFQAAMHDVLHRLREKHAQEHATLLHALAMFACQLFSSDPAHSCYLRSQLLGYLGQARKRLQYLHFAFLLTPPGDHSFLTKAQEYWSELLDDSQYEEAERFLLMLNRTAPAEYHDEIEKMIADAFRFIHSARRAS